MPDAPFHHHGPDSVEYFVGLYDLAKARDPRLVSESCRFPFNAPQPMKFENEYFAGEVLLMHKTPDPRMTFAYEEYLAPKQRRWELRWQGQFKKPVPPGVLLGIEVDDPLPQFGLATRTVVKVLLALAAKVSAAKGSKLVCNYGNQREDESLQFLFPLQSADSTTLHDANDENIPDIRQHAELKGKVPMDHRYQMGKVYTFSYFSMYCDFATWDIRNIFGASGTNLGRVIGKQPIRIVIKDPTTDTYYINLLLTHRSLSPEWAHTLEGSTSARSYRMNSSIMDSSNEGVFFSARSHWSDTDVLSSHGYQLEKRRPSRARPVGSSGALFRGAKKVATSPFKLAFYMAQATTSAVKYACVGGCLHAMSSPIPAGSSTRKRKAMLGASIPAVAPLA